MTEADLRRLMVEYGRSLFLRGYSCGSSGNLSAKLADGTILLTPTDVSLGTLDAGGLSHLAPDGGHLGGGAATKESWLHLAAYRARPGCGAIVHLHSTHAVALSCLEGRDATDMLPPITPYSVMRVGRLPLLPYSRPGDRSCAPQVEAMLRGHRAVLLANHGPVVTGPDLPAAIASAEELEETAKLFFLLRDLPHRTLTASEVADLVATFGQ